MPASPFDPFSYIFNVDLNTQDFFTPPNVRIGELRCVLAGAILVDTVLTKGVLLLVTSYDIVHADITRIYKAGTDPALYSSITAFGWERSL
jgi:hypothetical protein